LYNPSSAIRACTASSETYFAKAAQAPASSEKFKSEEVSLELGWWDLPSSSSTVAVKAAVEDARKALLASTNNKSTTAFSYSGNSLVGLYAGHGVLHSDAATTALQHFTQHLEAQETIGRVLLQYCGVNSNKALGIVVDTSGDFQAVQRIMRDWNEAKCQTDFDGSKKLTNTALRLERPVAYSNSTTDHLARRHLHHGAHHHHSIHRRATCEYLQIASGDTCTTLAGECGITLAKFKDFNSGLCDTPLAVGEYVCCTSGSLPDLTPKPEPDGTCASVVVEAGQWCSTIAAANGITVEDLDEFNKNTWGWAGCDLLQAQQRICISEGDPPMPASIENAVCGPQVPGTEKPTNGTELADLNPCPLNSCCNIWGQCGITHEFCTVTESPTGAPGTSANGTTGCVSNCGTDIVNNDTPPDTFITIGYFEAWNFERECLNMDITYFDTSAYSHLHFAFAEITEDYQVDVSAVQDQFDSLLSMGDVHRVLSFGGWSFSTEVDSFPIFREGVTDANRELFATNVVNFIVDNDLEGVDFDWEYPGAPDIPGIPAGDAGDGERYLQFLKLVREKLPDSKTLAIAAPASFWYLKGFPIAEISEVVDYIVYMTYDLHGQWDYGNQYATPGCPEGNCLRSHVNLTETTSALSMITKAGVPSNKIIVGLASYGRSFKMIEAGCTGPMCKYVGPDSAAAKGECTNTAGYIADAEIYRILDEDATAETYYDNSSDSNILVYGSTEWVAFMDEDTRISRTNYYEGLNMGGTTDWAVDLQSFAFSGGGNGGDSDGDAPLNQSIVYISPRIWTDAGDSAAVQCPAPCVLVLPDFPLGSTSVISRPPYVTTLDVAWPTAATLTTGGSTVTTTTVTHILQETTINAPAGMSTSNSIFSWWSIADI
jgi:GH18 family chitinase